MKRIDAHQQSSRISSEAVGIFRALIQSTDRYERQELHAALHLPFWKWPCIRFSSEICVNPPGSDQYREFAAARALYDELARPVDRQLVR